MYIYCSFVRVIVYRIVPVKLIVMAGSLKNDLVHLTPLRIPLMNPP
jgi:hypothetical protein